MSSRCVEFIPLFMTRNRDLPLLTLRLDDRMGFPFRQRVSVESSRLDHWASGLRLIFRGEAARSQKCSVVVVYMYTHLLSRQLGLEGFFPLRGLAVCRLISHVGDDDRPNRSSLLSARGVESRVSFPGTNDSPDSPLPRCPAGAAHSASARSD